MVVAMAPAMQEGVVKKGDAFCLELLGGEVAELVAACGAAGNAYAREALRAGPAAAAAAAERVGGGVAAVEAAVAAEVAARRPALLRQLGSVAEAEASLASLRAGVAALSQAARRVRAEVAEPVLGVASRSAHLRRLHATVELLRDSARFLRLLRRLRAAPPESDVAKAAELLAELERLHAEAGLTGIHVVEQHSAWRRDAGAVVRASASARLSAGLESLNQAEIGGALQVFFNLGQLREQVESLLHRYAAAAAAPSASLEDVEAAVMSVWQLQRVLAKQRDPVTHTLFLDKVMDEEQQEQEHTPGLWVEQDQQQKQKRLPTQRLWAEAAVPTLVRIASGASSSVSSGGTSDASSSNFPRVLPQLQALLRRLSPALSQADKELLSSALEPLRGAYLEQVLRRLSGAAATREPARLVSAIREHVEAASPAGLAADVAQLADKAVAELAEKCRAGGAAPAVEVAARLLEAEHALAAPPLAPLRAVPLLRAAAVELAAPLFRAAEERMVKAVGRMHAELPDAATGGATGGAASATADGGGGSGYMREVETVSTELRERVIRRLAAAGGSGGGEVAAALTRRAAEGLVLGFVRNAAVAAPLTEAGKLRLVADMTEVEVVVEQQLQVPVERLGAAYGCLRSLRRLLFTEDDAAALAAEAASGGLPRTLLLHHLLLARLDPPPPLSPAARLGMSPAAYAAWLGGGGASEEEVLALLRAALPSPPSGGATSPVHALILRLLDDSHN